MPEEGKWKVGAKKVGTNAPKLKLKRSYRGKNVSVLIQVRAGDFRPQFRKIARVYR